MVRSVLACAVLAACVLLAPTAQAAPTTTTPAGGLVLQLEPTAEVVLYLGKIQVADGETWVDTIQEIPNPAFAKTLLFAGVAAGDGMVWFEWEDGGATQQTAPQAIAEGFFLVSDSLPFCPPEFNIVVADVADGRNLCIPVAGLLAICCIPDPATIGLLGVGVVGLALRRRL